MARIQRVDASAFDAPKAARRPTTLTPAQQERQRQQRQFNELIAQLGSPSDVFEVRLGTDEKAITVRQRLLRAASDSGKQVAVRRSRSGFYVGLMTPERLFNRGRRKAST